MSLLNRQEVKKEVLARREALRPGWNADRVAAYTFTVLEAELKRLIEKHIQAHPTKGKTIKFSQGEIKV